MTKPLVDRPRGARRAPGEQRRIFLETARQLFAERGYSGVTTREIAERADISDTLLYRHFRSKADLFAEAIVRPISDFIAEWLAMTNEIQAQEGWSEIEVMRAFVGGFYDLLRENRGLLLAYVATGVSDPEVVKGLDQVPLFTDALDTLAEASASELRRRRLHGVDAEIANRAVIGMIMAMVLFEDWLNIPGRGPRTRVEIVEEMAALTVYGVAHRPPASGTKGRNVGRSKKE